MCPWVQQLNWSVDFQFGFEPILSWMRFIGIDLKTNQSTRFRMFFRFYQIGLLMVFSICLTFLIYDLPAEEHLHWIEEKQPSKTYFNVRLLILTVDAVKTATTHILFSFAFRKRWNKLWGSLERMHHLVAPTLIIRLRNVSFISVVSVILTVQFEHWNVYSSMKLSAASRFHFQMGITLIFSLYTFLDKEGFTWITMLIYSTEDLVLIYCPSVTMLFFTVCYAASKNLAGIRMKTLKLKVQNPADAAHCIDQLKQYYFFNAEFIYEINHCFGWILLVETIYSFGRVINQIIILVVAGTNSELWYVYVCGLLFLNLVMTDLIIITFTSDKLGHEVLPALNIVDVSYSLSCSILNCYVQQATLLLRELDNLSHCHPALEPKVNRVISSCY